MTWTVYQLETPGGYRYAGHTVVKPGESPADAISDRLDEHNLDRTSALYGMAFAADNVITEHGQFFSEESAKLKERELYDATPPGLRLNRVRP